MESSVSKAFQSLILALQRGQEELVEFLIFEINNAEEKMCSEIDPHDNLQQCIVDYVNSEDSSVEIVELLLQYVYIGSTLYSFLIREKYISILEKLHDFGYRPKEGLPVASAVIKGSLGLLKFYLQRGYEVPQVAIEFANMYPNHITEYLQEIGYIKRKPSQYRDLENAPLGQEVKIEAAKKLDTMSRIDRELFLCRLRYMRDRDTLTEDNVIEMIKRY